jgi:hypothetical protein
LAGLSWQQIGIRRQPGCKAAPIATFRLRRHEDVHLRPEPVFDYDLITGPQVCGGGGEETQAEPMMSRANPVVGEEVNSRGV